MEADTGRYKHLVSLYLVSALSLAAVLGACTTTKRAAQIVVDHHVGMVRGAYDVVSGKAEEREQRRATLEADLEQSRTALALEPDPVRRLELLEQHVALQDELIAELGQSHGHHGGGHEQAKAETEGGEEAEAHKH